MKCAWCGKNFKPTGHGSHQKYCSLHCRQAAYRARRKAGKKTKPVKKTAPKTGNLLKLTKAQFDTLMTDGTDEALTFVAAHLKKAIGDPDTPANALAALSREYLDVINEIDDRAKKQQGPASSEVTSIDAPVDLEQL